MKLLFAALLAMWLAGCASDPDDRAFFTSGWLLPERGANERLMRQSSAYPP